MYPKGKVLHGFKVIDSRKIDEFRSVATLFEHEQSGLTLIHMGNDDENNAFCINFKTLPDDDSGKPHIMEHSVLAGSKKWNVKAPFMELRKGSVQSFMNAFTYPDKTIYPFSSRNEKDYYNLMDAYLSSVFFPKIYESEDILKQEGWHYELDSLDGELKYNGIVFNEMKGAKSSPDVYLYNMIQRSLFPDTLYRFQSGGDPDAIPSLTQEAFEEFHRKFYHTSNCMILVYGNNSLDPQLEVINDNFLKHFYKDQYCIHHPIAESLCLHTGVEAWICHSPEWNNG